MKYSDRLSSFSFESSATVADALSHRAVSEEHRELLMASSPVELHDTELMAQRLALALGPATTARYLPWGAGYVAAACLRQLRGRPLSGQELSLQGSSEATLCSGLFADLRSLASGPRLRAYLLAMGLLWPAFERISDRWLRLRRCFWLRF